MDPNSANMDPDEADLDPNSPDLDQDEADLDPNSKPQQGLTQRSLQLRSSASAGSQEVDPDDSSHPAQGVEAIALGHLPVYDGDVNMAHLGNDPFEVHTVLGLHHLAGVGPVTDGVGEAGAHQVVIIDHGKGEGG